MSVVQPHLQVGAHNDFRKTLVGLGKLRRLTLNSFLAVAKYLRDGEPFLKLACA
jgi:hypothetical protein